MKLSKSFYTAFKMINCVYSLSKGDVVSLFLMAQILYVICAWQCDEVVILPKSGISFHNVRLYFTNCYIWLLNSGYVMTAN